MKALELAGIADAIEFNDDGANKTMKEIASVKSAKRLKMPKIEVESEALDAIKKMAEQLQQERDELLKIAELAYETLNYIGYQKEMPDSLWVKSNAGETAMYLQGIIAKCTSKHEVLA